MAMVPFVPGLAMEPAVKTARCSKAEFTKSRRSAEKLYREGHFSDAVEGLRRTKESCWSALEATGFSFGTFKPGSPASKGLTWSQLDPEVRFEPDSHHKEGLRVEGHLVSGYLGKWALGDFNGDGVEDVLLVRSMGPEGGSAFDITTFLLTRTRPGGAVTLLERMECAGMRATLHTQTAAVSRLTPGRGWPALLTLLPLACVMLPAPMDAAEPVTTPAPSTVALASPVTPPSTAAPTVPATAGRVGPLCDTDWDDGQALQPLKTSTRTAFRRL